MKVPITPRITDTAKERFDKICQQEHRSQAEQVEYWIENYKFKDEKEGN